MPSKVSDPIIKSPRLRLFFISFLILFFELVAIRFIPSQIRYVGYFSNVILLASFVGIGLGTLFWRKIKLPSFLLPLIFLSFEFIIGALEYDLIVSSDQSIFFNTGFGRLAGEPIFLLPLIFFLVVFVFILPSKLMGELFEKFKPLTAYSINILGSILGILAFSFVSFIGGGPIVWFITILLLSFLVVERPRIKVWKFLYLLVFFPLLFELGGKFQPRQLPPYVEQEKVTWSPYYKITLYRIAPPEIPGNNFFTLNVNNIGHQSLVTPTSPYAEPFYEYPYKIFPEKKFKDVLIIGAGAGNDVSKALSEGATNVVALEIDPTIIKLGKTYHPEKPYSSQNVKIIVNDARSYLAEKEGKFDLIIFALTDSLMLSSGASNLRLESYLFTKESFQDARRHLKDGGMIVLYNYYRTPWIVDKLAYLLKDAFGRDPYVLFLPDTSSAAVLISAKPETQLPPSPSPLTSSTPTTPTDNWPFLYLKDKGIPKLYWSYLGVILLAVGIAFPLLLKRTRSRFDWGFFFLGAAFMLLETKNIVQFSLLFGSTWLTNSFVFSGLLSLVLLAILVAQKFPRIKLHWLYMLLFISIAVAFVFPQRELLNLAYIPRLVAAILINFSPVFVANIIFAFIFKETKVAPAAYGANTFGSFVGGIFEYTSLIWGYQYLTLFAALFYFLSLIFALKVNKRIF